MFGECVGVVSESYAMFMNLPGTTERVERTEYERNPTTTTIRRRRRKRRMKLM